MRKTERNAEILRLHKEGQGPTAIARQFAMKPDRVRQIIGQATLREKARAALVERFGENPDIAELPDDTPIEVLALCPGKFHGWETRIRALGWYPPTPVKTLGELRNTPNAQLRQNSLVGDSFLRELRRFCPGHEPTDKLASYRDTRAEARAALRMIREVVEQHAPPGSVPAEEYVEPPFSKEAEALVKGILAIVEAKH
jgi:hypothetical protein